MQFTFDPLQYRYPSRRHLVYAKKGMVATSNALAAQVGLDILRKGGNAIDAIVATATTLTVVEPTSNGIGSDAFAMVHTGGKLYGLNASGPAPGALTAGRLHERGYDSMPENGVCPINVPGAPSAWAALSGRFGRLPLAEVMAPAARYAEEGFVLQPCVGSEWPHAFDRYRRALPDHPALAGWFDTFAPGGRPLHTGDVLRLPHHAATLREIAESGAESFYRGRLAGVIDAFMREAGGFLAGEDLAAYKPEWVEPLTTHYRGYDVYEMPPNGQGMTVLMALNILRELPVDPYGSFEAVHRQLEALKLAFSDVQHYVAEPAAMQAGVADMLSEGYAARRRALIGPEALAPEHGVPAGGDTVYLCAADDEGNMVSYIQSNYMGFGSGVVVPGTGIALHNRGCNFSLDPASGNFLQPGKRPYHTIIPGFLCKDGKPVGPFGIMGGFIQPQAHLQVLVNLLDYGMNPQEALDRPRWRWMGGKAVEVEQAFEPHLARRLQRAGHEIAVMADSSSFGRGQVIWRDDDGVLCGACEPRTDSVVAAW